jgi:hypothetical protein
MVGAKPRNLCRSLFKTLEILPLPCEEIFSLMNFFINNLELFQINSTKAVLTQRIRTIFIDQLPTFHVLKKVLTMLASKSSIVYHLV